MARQRLFVAFVGLLIVAKIGIVNSYAWHDPTSQQHYHGQRFQHQHRQPSRYGQTSNVEIVQGTIDQLNNIDVKWVCTNPKTGDQMIFGAENGNGNFANNNEYPQTNLPAQNVNYWNVQQPGYNPQGQVPIYNPSQMQQPQDPFQTQYQRNPFLTQQPQNPSNSQQSNNPFLTQQPKNPSQTQQSQNPSGTEQSQDLGFITEPSVNGQNEVPTSTVKMTIEDMRKKFDNFDWTQYVTINPVTSSTSSKTVETDGDGMIDIRSNF